MILQNYYEGGRENMILVRLGKRCRRFNGVLAWHQSETGASGGNIKHFCPIKIT